MYKNGKVDSLFRARHCQKYALYQKKAQNKSCSRFNLVQESQWTHTSLSLRGCQGAPKIATFEILNCTKAAKQIHSRADGCQKYELCQKFLQIKVVKDSISFKKVSGHLRLSPRGELNVPKIAVFKILRYIRKWQSRFTLQLNATKNTHYVKNFFR